MFLCDNLAPEGGQVYFFLQNYCTRWKSYGSFQLAFKVRSFLPQSLKLSFILTHRESSPRQVLQSSATQGFGFNSARISSTTTLCWAQCQICQENARNCKHGSSLQTCFTNWKGRVQACMMRFYTCLCVKYHVWCCTIN